MQNRLVRRRGFLARGGHAEVYRVERVDAFETNASTYAVEAQKSAFGKQWFFKATGDDGNGRILSFAENAKAVALTVSLNADGKTAQPFP